MGRVEALECQNETSSRNFRTKPQLRDEQNASGGIGTRKRRIFVLADETETKPKRSEVNIPLMRMGIGWDPMTLTNSEIFEHVGRVITHGLNSTNTGVL